MKRLKEYSVRMRVVVYCGSFSCPTSGKEVKGLKVMGFRNVKHYAGGLKDW